ncbi:MAG: hypothetical protein ACLTDS_08765 [Bianqueaceae bacterium]
MSYWILHCGMGRRRRITFSVEDKIKILLALDQLGIRPEAGNPHPI